jgi:hypothetical protein
VLKLSSPECAAADLVLRLEAEAEQARVRALELVNESLDGWRARALVQLQTRLDLPRSLRRALPGAVPGPVFVATAARKSRQAAGVVRRT